jgi:hypothetical protein
MGREYTVPRLPAAKVGMRPVHFPIIGVIAIDYGRCCSSCAL